MKKTVFFLMILALSPVESLWSQAVVQSTLEDQSSVEVTVYNSNLGLIKDVREIALAQGGGELRFQDVAKHIMPVTVHTKSLNQPTQFGVLEQNYEYDLMNENKLLDKYVGRKIKIVDVNEFQGKKEVIEAKLLSNNSGQIYKINDEIYLGYPGMKVLPSLPENLIARPTLTWLYQNQSKTPHKLEVSYLTNQINWKADYVVVIDEKDAFCDLSGWVTVDNRSGTTYKDAKLKLVAGDVNRVSSQAPGRRMLMAEMAMADVGGKQFQEKSFFEYHIYDLQRKTTIKDNQTKQVSLLEASKVGLKKELLVYGATHYFSRRYRGNVPKQPVQVYFEFKNSEDNKLGMPLPAGVMRLYKKDDEGSLQFIGEDRIQHTPRNEEVRLKVGEAFDVVAERRQTDYRKISDDKYESEWEIAIRNHKKEKITVGLIEPLYGSWKVIKKTHAFSKEDAFTLRFDVEVPADGEVKVVYRIQVKN